MKLRIKDNTLRLRLSQSELKTCEDKGVFSSSVSFGPGADKTLTYSIVITDRDQMAANFNQNTIEILIPQKMARTWSATDKVTISNDMKIDDDESLIILVEKDFQCLHKRPGEEEKDNFPNPLAEKIK